MAEHRKVMIIGLDGATWRVLDPMMRLGVMPNLARLCDRGAVAPLQSTIPPYTPVAWTTLSTGLDPGGHGVFGFAVPRPDSPTYTPPPVNRTAVNAPSLWARLSAAGKRCTVLCVPLTYPPEAINGHLVTGMFTPSLNSRCTHPESLKDELLKNNAMPKFRLDLTERCAAGRSDERIREALENTGQTLFDDLNDLTDRLDRTVQYLAAKPWDFFMAVFQATDQIQHFLWDRITLAMTGADDAWSERIRGVYHRVDEAVGRMTALAGPETLVMVVSDHGFGPCAGQYALGRWLVDEGFARLARRRWTGAARSLLDMLGLKALVRRSISTRTLARGLSAAMPFDWSRTCAYFAPGSCGIRINLKGREPQGIVSPGPESGELRNSLRERLLAAKDAASRRPIVSQVWHPEEIYAGPHLAAAPDLILEPDDELGFNFACGDPHNPRRVTPMLHSVGSHRREGVLVVCNAGVPKEAVLLPELPQLTDIAPTVHFWMNLPVPPEYHGSGFRVGQPPSTPGAALHPDRLKSLSSQPSPLIHQENAPYDSDSSTQIENHLRNLGYFD